MSHTELFPNLCLEITELDVLLMFISVGIPAGNKRHIQWDKLRKIYRGMIYKSVVRLSGNPQRMADHRGQLLASLSLGERGVGSPKSGGREDWVERTS